MMKPSLWKKAIINFNRALFEDCSKAVLEGSKDGVFYRPDRNTFQNCENIAIDYAVMENLGSIQQKSSIIDQSINSCVVDLDVGWSDVGSWITLANIWSDGNDVDPHCLDRFDSRFTHTLVVIVWPADSPEASVYVTAPTFPDFIEPEMRVSEATQHKAEKLKELRKLLRRKSGLTPEEQFEKAAKIRDEITAFEKDLGIAVS